MALNTFQHIHGFSAGKHADMCWSAYVSKSQPNNIAFVFSFTRLVRILGNFCLRVQRDQR